MQLKLDERFEGSIEGLRLPLYVWEVLDKANIATIHDLRAVADRLERFEGIGPKTAQIVRAELARVASVKEQSLAKG